VTTAHFLLRTVGGSFRLLSKPLVGVFSVGLSYKVLRIHRACLVVEDDHGKEWPINFARFDFKGLE
jgi:hypothetical protein